MQGNTGARCAALSLATLTYHPSAHGDGSQAMTKAISTRKQLGEDSRQRILDAASEIAGERGYEGTLINLIWQRAGLIDLLALHQQ